MFAHPSSNPWVNDNRKYKYKRQLLENKQLKDLDDKEKKLQDYLLKFLQSNSPRKLNLFENKVEQLLKEKPGTKLNLTTNSDVKDDYISIPSIWEPRSEGWFGPKGSELFQVLQDLPTSFTKKQQDELEEIYHLVEKAEKVIKEFNKNSGEEKEDSWVFLKRLSEIYTKISDLEYAGSNYWMALDTESPLAKVDDWMCYEYTRLFNTVSAVGDDKFGYNIRGALNKLLKVEDQAYTNDWKVIKNALAVLDSPEDLRLLKAILDDYVYQQAVTILKIDYGKNIGFINEDNVEDILEKILTKFKNVPLIKKSMEKSTFGSLSIEEFRMLLLTRQSAMGEDIVLTANPIFYDFYRSQQKIDPQDTHEEIEEKAVVVENVKPSHETTLSLGQRLKSAFDTTFYVYDDNHNKRDFLHYFLGWPENNNVREDRLGQILLGLDYVFYFLGGEVLITAKNILKLGFELFPKSVEVFFNHCADKAKENNHASIGEILSAISLVPRAFWAAGRAMTSPLTSLKAAITTGEEFGKKHGKIAGIFASFSLSVLSLAFSAAAVVAVAIVAPVALIAVAAKVGITIAVTTALAIGAGVCMHMASQEVIRSCEKPSPSFSASNLEASPSAKKEFSEVEKPRSPSLTSSSSYSRNYKDILPISGSKTHSVEATLSPSPSDGAPVVNKKVKENNSKEEKESVLPRSLSFSRTS